MFFKKKYILFNHICATTEESPTDKNLQCPMEIEVLALLQNKKYVLSDFRIKLQMPLKFVGVFYN